MLTPLRLTFSVLCIFITACSKPPALEHLYELTSGSLLHAEFNQQGTLVISTLDQVAVYSQDGSLQALIDMPRANYSWQVEWLAPSLVGLADGQHLYLWAYADNKLTGPWVAHENKITAFTAAAGFLIIGYDDGRLERIQYNSDFNLQTRQQLIAASTNSAEYPARIFDVISYTDDFAVLYQNGKFVYYTENETRPIWQIELPQAPRIRAAWLDKSQLYLVSQHHADHFSRGGEQQIVQIEKNNGKIRQMETTYLSGRGVSLLPFENSNNFDAYVIGSSENCMHIAISGELAQSFCHPKPKRFGKNSGQVIALHQDAEYLYAVSTAGFLQVWRKQDIVDLLTDR